MTIINMYSIEQEKLEKDQQPAYQQLHYHTAVTLVAMLKTGLLPYLHSIGKLHQFTKEYHNITLSRTNKTFELLPGCLIDHSGREFASQNLPEKGEETSVVPGYI